MDKYLNIVDEQFLCMQREWQEEEAETRESVSEGKGERCGAERTE